MRIVDAGDLDSLTTLFAGGWDAPPDVRAGVTAIVADVRARGDAAVVDYTRRFDAPEFDASMLRVAVPPLAQARGLVPPEVAAALELARDRVAAFHERQSAHDTRHQDADGTVSGLLVRPLASVGAYVPGGTAALPSTVVMTAVPARIAGVGRVLVATPPGRNGRIPGGTLFACSLCGVDEVIAAGGAQAIAALAFGTQTIARVDKIVGPGNVWVTEAKRQLFGTCGIDSLAGPSEVLVVADATSRPDFVAAELVAQAEHDPLARVAAISQDRAVLERVAALLDGVVTGDADRTPIVAAVLRERTFLVHARDRAALVDVIDRFAPEHLSLQTADPWELVPHVRRAGAIFVGSHTPVASGDYIAGSNHVLPTSGAARFSSGLRLADFTRTMSVVENSAQRMRADAAPLETLASFEGLPAHARTARMRR